MKQIVLISLFLLIAIKSGEAFLCPAQGSFPDKASSDCTTFYKCFVAGEDGTLIRCPTSFIFNPDKKGCDFISNYECPPITTEATPTIAPIVFECPDVGFYVDQNSADCTSYFACIRQLDRSLLKLSKKCLFNTVFNPASRLCISNKLYTCAPTTTTPDDTKYQCPGIGYFADPSSNDCVKYFYCARKLNLSLEAKEKSCPKYTIFNAVLRLCVLSSFYTCPLTLPKTTLPTGGFICPDVGNFIDGNSVDCRSYYSCTRNLQKELVSKLTNCIGNTYFDPARRMCVTSFYYKCPTTDTTDPSPPTFECPSIGYFADPNSKNCKSYWSCIRNLNLTLQATYLTCPGSTVFDNVRRLCVTGAFFKCPIV